MSTALLLLTCAGWGSVWHHWQWSAVRTDHIAAFATETAAPVRLIATIEDAPVVLQPREDKLAGGTPRTERTVCTIRCQELVTGAERIAVSGLARFEVQGVAYGYGIGDRVQIVGRCSRPSGSRNPGGFDFRRYLRVSGIHVVVRCGEPEGIQLLEPGSGLRRLMSNVRAEAERVLAQSLTERTEAVGLAMLLGTRSNLPDDVREAFKVSGTMHVLAISGLHVAILAGLLWAVCRAVGLPRRRSILLVLAGIMFYAAITDAQPPVVRAVLMITVFVAGQPWFRRASMLNTLAVSALGVMALNPSHLFDIGAQLSFLAVGALLWVPAWRKPVSEVEPMVPITLWDHVVEWVRPAARWVWAGLETGIAVWLFTLPLTMATFKLVSPVGLAVNILISPLSVAVLWFGYALLFVGLIAPPLAAPFGWGYDGGLRLMLSLVESAAAVPGGHHTVIGPATWWLTGFYACLLALVSTRGGTRWRTVAARGLFAWIVLGLAIGFSAPQRQGLRCTFLSVGHGVSVLLELPNGRALLYDAGQLEDPQRAEQTIENALWSHGLTQVDGVVLSHADVDHFNAVPRLAEAGCLRAVLVHRSFLDFHQETIVEACDRCAKRGVPIQLIWGGDRLRLDPDVQIEVLQPAVNRQWSKDNANSVVLRVQYQGRTVLLTGDLEGEGLATLLHRPRQPVDVMLSPHHGSIGSNTLLLSAWASPRLVVASTDHGGVEARLQQVYGPDTMVMTTREAGAVEVQISPEGELDWSSHRDARSLRTQ